MDVTNIQCNGCKRGYPLKDFRWFVEAYYSEEDDLLWFCPSCVKDMTLGLEGHVATALAFYADPDHYEGRGGEDLFSDVMCDGGELARNVLAAIGDWFSDVLFDGGELARNAPAIAGE